MKKRKSNIIPLIFLGDVIFDPKGEAKDRLMEWKSTETAQLLCIDMTCSGIKNDAPIITSLFLLL